MADYFIDSTATGANSGLNWADAYNSGGNADWTSAAAAASTVGDRILVAASNATVTTADLVLTVNAAHTKSNPLQILVVTPSGATGYTSLSTYGTAGNGEISGAAGNNHITFNGGHVITHALRLLVGDSFSVGNSPQIIHENGLFKCSKTSQAEAFSIGSGNSLSFIDSDIEFTGNDHAIDSGGDGCQLLMRGGEVTTDASVGEVFRCRAGQSLTCNISGTDFTGMNAATSFFGTGGVVENFVGILRNIVPPSTIPPLLSGSISNLTRGSEMNLYTGDGITKGLVREQGIISDNTTIYRSGGASYDSTAYSLKVASTSDASRPAPLRFQMAIMAAEDLNGKGVKVHFAQNSGAALDSSQVWIEVEAEQTAGGMFRGTTRALLGDTGTTCTDESGSVDWRNGASALTGYNEQSCSVSVGQATSGLIAVWFCVTGDFTTTNSLYVDPTPVVA